MAAEESYEKIFNFYVKLKEHLFKTDTAWLYKDVNERQFVFDHEKLFHHKKEVAYSVNNINEPINIFIIGEGNYGKSTLINSIARGNIAETNFLPNTWCIQKYYFGESKSIIYYEDKPDYTCSHEEAANILKEEERNQKQNKSYISTIYKVVHYFNNYPILKHFVIVDTPGLAQVRSLKSQQTIEDYYYQADCILWLFDSQRVNSENTLKYIAKMSRFTKKTIGVLNKWDMVKDDDSKIRILELLNKNFGNFIADVQPVSAKMAWDNIMNKDGYFKSNIPILLNKIKTIFLENKEMNKNQSLYFQSKVVFNEAADILNNEIKVSNKNKEIYKNNIAKIKSERYTCADKACEEFGKKFEEQFSSIYSNIRCTVLPSNAEHMVNEVLLDPKNVNNKVETAIQHAMRIKDKLIYDTIRELSKEEYIEVQYDKDGSVLSQFDLPSFSNLPNYKLSETIYININLKISGFSKFVDSLMQLGTILPFIGNAISKELNASRNAFREDIVKQIKEASLPHKQRTSNEIRRIVNSNFQLLLSVLEKQFEFHFKSEQSLTQKIHNLNNLFNSSVIPQNRFALMFLTKIKKGIKNARFSKN